MEHAFEPEDLHGDGLSGSDIVDFHAVDEECVQGPGCLVGKVLDEIRSAIDVEGTFDFIGAVPTDVFDCAVME